ncbi:LysR family transcriptional regulator [Psychromonas antarctica]|uniref:LysR family transcriptional regulator n=1 Tax=Psychromonas antarctica TaxID=67573 RepID=UPI001EE90DC5|nr:LysR family transcriptional regulator [Psychromonas antarctica]MCG6202182.1 LysR family transcriptional regulator [Psychromonas antarctica]
MAFLVTAEEGSLSAAGRALGIAQPTVGRQVAALEKELDVILFDRVGKQLILTKVGLELVYYVQQMSEAASRVSIAVSGQSQVLDGEVCISAIDSIAALCLPPIIQKLRVCYPGINIKVIASNELSNLGQKEADIAIRNIQPSHPDLIAKKICDVAARLYGSKEYLDRLGRPITVAKLNTAEFAGFERTDKAIIPLRHFGLTLTQDNFSVICENHLVQWENTKQGIVVGMMLEAIGDKEPLVERAQPDVDPIVFPIWLVAHKQLKTSKRVRVVFDMLSDSLAELSVVDGSHN